MALTDREKAILLIAASGASDYKIARKLHYYTNSIRRSRLNALRKMERAKADLEFKHYLDIKNSGKD